MGAVQRVATAKKPCMPQLIPLLGAAQLEVGPRSKHQGVVSPVSGECTIRIPLADQPRQTASIGPLSTRESCAAAFSFNAAFRYSQPQTARPGRTVSRIGGAPGVQLQPFAGLIPFGGRCFAFASISSRMPFARFSSPTVFVGCLTCRLICYGCRQAIEDERVRLPGLSPQRIRPDDCSLERSCLRF